MKHTREREAIYLKASALSDFIAHMSAYVQQKDDLIKTKAPSPEDAQESD